MKIYKNPNTKTIYRQYDSRWGNLPYPVLPSTMAKCGCGDCSITHCLIESNKYAKYTPKTIISYMRKYAVAGHGTKHIGMPEALKHYGYTEVKEHSTMADLFKELKKGDRVGVLLFGTNKAPDGTLWTSAGHFVAFVGYKTTNDGKKNYLYTKDSGGRWNDGWHCYETSMKGCVRKVWSAKVTEFIILPERGYFKLGDKSDSIRIIQQFLKDQGLYNGKIGGRYGTLTKKAVKKFQKAHGLDPDGLWGKDTQDLYERLK